MKNKENALQDFLKMIKSSWTYDRLTENEKKRLLEFYTNININDKLKGTYENRWQTLYMTYHAFLIALDYQLTNWREPKDNDTSNF